MPEQREDSNKETKTIKKNQRETLELKFIAKMKTIANCRRQKKQSANLGVSSVEIIQSKEQEE